MEKWITAFLNYLQHERRASMHTIQSYKTDLLAASAFFSTQHNAGLDTLDDHHIRAWLIAKRQQTLSARSLSRHLSALRSFFRYLQREGLVKDNPAERVMAPKMQRTLPKALDVDQMAQLLSLPDSDPLAIRDLAIMELMYSAGLRISELVSLNTTDLDLAQQQLYVIGKGKKTRLSIIGRFALQALTKWLSLRPNFATLSDPALFISRSGKRLSARAIQLRFYQLGLKQGIDSRVHPHRLRHSFASHLLESSQDLRAVQELLGHADISTTQIYAKLDFQHLATVYDQCHPRSTRAIRSQEKAVIKPCNHD